MPALGEALRRRQQLDTGTDCKCADRTAAPFAQHFIPALLPVRRPSKPTPPAMACLGPPSAAPQPRLSTVAAQHAGATHARSRGGGVASRQAAAGGTGSGWAASGRQLRSRLQLRPATPGVGPYKAAAASSDNSASSGKRSSKPSGSTPEVRHRGGSRATPVPDVEAEQLLRSLGLSGTADPAALHRNLRKLPGVRQQGVLDNAAAVAAHLRRPAVALTAQQVGQLLERCPRLFSWPPEQRAAVLFGQLLGAGVTAAEAAQCFVMFQYAANCTTLAAGLAELAAILARSEDRDSSLGGRTAKVPAAQRTVAALLSQTPSAVKLVCQRAGHLQQHAAELQQAGLTAAQVAAVAWDRPEALSSDTAGRVASRAAVLQQELGLPAAAVVALVVKGKPSWLTSSVATLRERAAALAEGFGRAAAAGMLLKNPSALNCDPAVWRRNLCYMAACGVGDPKAVLRQGPYLLHVDHAALGFLQRRLLLQRVAQLTVAQLYEQHPFWLLRRKVPDLAQRLHFVEQRGCDVRQLLYRVLHDPLAQLLAAVGASEAEWAAWAAANPPAACPLYGWAQQVAAEEAARLAAVLPPELVQFEPRQHARRRRKDAPAS